MLTLRNLRSPKGALRKARRLGRGPGSGRGTQAGKGHKGQKARSGGGVRTGFIGGAMPLYMRLPKRGFTNAPFRRPCAVVTLGRLASAFGASETVTRESLVAKGILKGRRRSLPVKVLAGGEFEKPLSFVGIDAFSRAAREAVEKAGGSIAKGAPDVAS